MNKKLLIPIGILALIVIVGIVIIIGQQKSLEEQQVITPPPVVSNALIGDLKFGMPPVGIGTPDWKPKPGWQPEYKTVFSPGQQVMLDFFQVTKPMSVEVKMYDQNDQEINFFVPFSLKTGNNGNCCFDLPTQPGKYTVKVFSAGEIVLTKNLEIK